MADDVAPAPRPLPPDRSLEFLDIAWQGIGELWAATSDARLREMIARTRFAIYCTQAELLEKQHGEA